MSRQRAGPQRQRAGEARAVDRGELLAPCRASGAQRSGHQSHRAACVASAPLLGSQLGVEPRRHRRAGWLRRRLRASARARRGRAHRTRPVRRSPGTPARCGVRRRAVRGSPWSTSRARRAGGRRRRSRRAAPNRSQLLVATGQAVDDVRRAGRAGVQAAENVVEVPSGDPADDVAHAAAGDAVCDVVPDIADASVDRGATTVDASLHTFFDAGGSGRSRRKHEGNRRSDRRGRRQGSNAGTARTPVVQHICSTGSWSVVLQSDPVSGADR